jgi:spore maturation protein CgeB
MRILYIDPVVRTTTSSKYRYYDGIFDQLGKTNEVYLYRGVLRDINDFVNYAGITPDMIIFGLGWFGSTKYFGKINNLNVPTVCYFFKPQNDLEQKLEFCRLNDIDLILTPVPAYKHYEKITGVKTRLFPYGYDPELFKSREEIEKKYDIGFSGALHQSALYPEGSFSSKNLRSRIYEKLQELKEKNNLNIFWKSSDEYQGARIHDHTEYAHTINESKIWIATKAAASDITPRYYEVLGSNTLLFCEEVDEEYEAIFKNKINCVTFKSDLSDFEEKLNFYLSHERERLAIVDQAQKDALEYFTWKHRADNLLEIVNQEVGI